MSVMRVLRGAAVLAATVLTGGPALACNLALALAIDVSGSIDPGEYRFQMGGMADALEDPAIADVLVLGQAAVTVIQWSGADEQEVSIPWQRMLSHDHIARLAERVRGTKRRWSDSKTAPGDAVAFILEEFAKVEDCKRRVIDISGDGMTNDGRDAGQIRARARARDITINGVAIDRVGRSVTQFYRNHLITGRDSFVMTATGYSDYPRAIEEKLFREVVRPGS